MNKDLVDLAISMTEIDTGIELSLEEREAMAQSILAKIEDTNRQCTFGAREGLIVLFCAELDLSAAELYNRYMKLFGLTFRSPIVRYISTPLEEDVYDAIRNSIIEDIINEMKEETKHNIEIIKLFGPRP